MEKQRNWVLGPNMSYERIGHILLRQGVIDTQKLDFCLKVQKNNGGERIGKVLKHYAFINEEQIANALAQQVGWALYDGDYDVDEDLVSCFGVDYLLERMLLPVRDGGEAVFVVSQTDDMGTTDHVQSQINRKVRFCVAPESRLRQALEQLSLKMKAAPVIKSEDSIDDNLVNWLSGHLDQAVSLGATDIHIEPSQKTVEMRFRIDGILHFIDSLRLTQLSRLVNIVFHKADVTISDFNHFHDARFNHSYLNRSIDIRISHIPSVHGSSLVLRLLDKAKATIGLTDLGYGQKQWDLIQANLNKPEGMTLIVGPTGCGKTTTLYAMLNHLKSISKKIVTVEDPVEMHLPLLMQVQTNERRDVTFANTVRAFLRHDPNIILIGEIRDAETAKEAMRAAMTGHKVFATLHANRPIDAILRLNDLGVPYSHIAGNLTMVIAQRLLRRSVNGSFKGRTVVAETLSINDAIEDMIGRGDIAALRKWLKEDPDYVTMHNDAGRLVGCGVTTQEELRRVLG